MSTRHNDVLRSKAESVELFLKKYFLDKNNIVFTQLDKDTLKPPVETFFPVAQSDMSIMDYWIENYTRSGIAAYENCGMTTGAYLQALLLKFKVEEDSAVIEQARKCYSGLKYIYDTGKELEEGFFPKVYDNKFSVQTSTDQVLYAVTAMDKFFEYADSDEQNDIAGMIPKMTEFWMKRDYKYLYFHIDNMQWPVTRFPPLLLLAYKYSGKEKFKNEYEKQLKEGFAHKPEWAQLTMKKAGEKPLSEYEKEQNAYFVANMADCITMDVMNFDILLKNDPNNPLAEKWKQGVLQMWEEAKITLLPNGKYLSQVLVDFKTGQVRRIDGFENGDTHPGSQSGWSTMVARGAAMALEYFPDRKDMESAAWNVIDKIDVDEMTYHDEPERWAPRYRFKTRFLSGDSISNWLWAYWKLRYIKNR
jgi:hypothetical protein